MPQPRAKNRLTEMVVQEVSLVDRAANLEEFLILKNEGAMPNDVMKLKLPKAQKTTLMEGLAKVLDNLTALATVVGDAEEDDTAAVPDDVYAQLKTTAEMLGALGNAGNAAAPPEGAPASDGAETTPPNQVTAAAPDEQVGKRLPPPQTTSLNIKQPETVSLNPEQALHKAVAALHNEIAEKAGRKIAAARFGKLRELHDNLGKLLNELAYDDANAAAAPPEGKQKNEGAPGAPVVAAAAPPPVPAVAPAPSQQQPPPVAGPVVPPDALADLRKSQEAAAQVLANISKRLDAAEGRTSTAKAVGNAPPAGNGGSSAEGRGAPKQERVVWPMDMSADVKKRRQQKQTAAR